MHCIAKTLLTELHLAILVPLSRLSFSRVYRWSSSPLMRFSLSSPNLRFSVLSFFFSWRIIRWRDEEGEQRRRRRHCASCGIVGSRGGVGKPMGQDSETWNGIPEFLILLVNKCLGDSLLVRSYRPSSVSRRHCVLRFHLVFRSNGFPWLTVDKVAPETLTPVSIYLLFSSLLYFFSLFFFSVAIFFSFF